MFHRIQSPEIQTLGEWIVDQPVRHAQHVRPMDLLHAKALQGTKVIDVSQLAPQLFEDFPVPVPSGASICLFQVLLKISLHRIVVEERIINIEQEHDSWRFGHRHLFSF
jgi:hypothetical protein